MILRKLILGLASASASFYGVAYAANSVSGDVDFKVTVPEILVLYHWDEAHLEFNDFTKVYNTNQTVTVTDDFGNSSYTVDGNTDVTTTDLPAGFDTTNSIKVTLQDSWAVRTLSSANVDLAIAIKDESLKHGTSKILVKNANVQSTNAGNNATEPGPATTIDLEPGWAPKLGDITFDLDMSGVTEAGLHSGDDETFTLTLTGN